MQRFWSAFVIVVVMLGSTLAFAEPDDDAGNLIDRWATAFNANDVDALLALYAPDATFIGTVGLSVKQGNEAIRAYYARLANSGDSVAIGEHETVAVAADAAYVTGDYEFSAMRNGERQTAVARFTMLLVKRDGGWLIAHHHSSHQLERTPLRSRRALQAEHRLASTRSTTRTVASASNPRVTLPCHEPGCGLRVQTRY